MEFLLFLKHRENYQHGDISFNLKGNGNHFLVSQRSSETNSEEELCCQHTVFCFFTRAIIQVLVSSACRNNFTLRNYKMYFQTYADCRIDRNVGRTYISPDDSPKRVPRRLGQLNLYQVRLGQGNLSQVRLSQVRLVFKKKSNFCPNCLRVNCPWANCPVAIFPTRIELSLLPHKLWRETLHKNSPSHKYV